MWAPLANDSHARLPFVFPHRESPSGSLRRAPFAPAWFPLNSRIKVYTASSVARVHREKHHKIEIQYRKQRTGQGVTRRGFRGRGHVVCVTRMSRGAGSRDRRYTSYVKAQFGNIIENIHVKTARSVYSQLWEIFSLRRTIDRYPR